MPPIMWTRSYYAVAVPLCPPVGSCITRQSRFGPATARPTHSLTTECKHSLGGVDYSRPTHDTASVAANGPVCVVYSRVRSFLISSTTGRSGAHRVSACSVAGVADADSEVRLLLFVFFVDEVAATSSISAVETSIFLPCLAAHALWSLPVQKLKLHLGHLTGQSRG